MNNSFKNNIELERTVFGDKKGNFITEILQSIVIAIFISITIYIFIATPNQVLGDSMQPNFHNGELLLTNKVTQWLGESDFGRSLSLEYQRGDVIVFHKPGADKDLIKRIIGLPGETILLENGSIYVNDELLIESYISPEVRTTGGTFLREGQSKVIPEHHYFVMGDNRTNSQDSRYVEVGFINRDWMKGKVILRYWPPNTFGIISAGDYSLPQ